MRATDKVIQTNQNTAKNQNGKYNYKMAAKKQFPSRDQKWEKPLSRKNFSLKFGS